MRVRAAPRKQDKSDQAHSEQENCGIFRGRNVSSDAGVLNRIVPDSATCRAVACEEIECGWIRTSEIDLAPLEQEQVRARRNLKVIRAERGIYETLVAARLSVAGKRNSVSGETGIDEGGQTRAGAVIQFNRAGVSAAGGEGAADLIGGSGVGANCRRQHYEGHCQEHPSEDAKQQFRAILFIHLS